MADPAGAIKRRLNSAIEWRVRDALERQLPAMHGVNSDIEALRASLLELSASLNDRLRAVEALIEQLDRRATR